MYDKIELCNKIIVTFRNPGRPQGEHQLSFFAWSADSQTDGTFKYNSKHQ